VNQFGISLNQFAREACAGAIAAMEPAQAERPPGPVDAAAVIHFLPQHPAATLFQRVPHNATL
jgi:hypothetical protein